MEVIYGLVNLETGIAVPVKVDETGRLVVLVQGLDGITVSVGPSVEISNDSGSPIPVMLESAQIGTPSTGVSEPTGGAGLLGWLSGIFSRLSGVLTVSGSAAAGSAPTAPPLSVSGIDANGLKRNLKTDINGNLGVFGTARSCVGRQTIDVTAGAVSTLIVPVGAAAAAIQADGSAVSITLDGSAPTAVVGTRIDDGVIYYVDTSLANVKLIARTASTKVQVVYFDKP